MRRRGPSLPFPPGPRRRLRGAPAAVVVVLVVAAWALREAGWRDRPEPLEPTDRRDRSRPGGPTAERPSEDPDRNVTVLSVADGDTVTLSTGEIVRYLGIDAPEWGEPFAAEAREENARLVEGRVLVFRRGGPERKDAYGRLLGILYATRLAGGGSGSVNVQLLRRGLVGIYLRGPDSVDSEILGECLAAQRDAVSQRAGMWRDRLEAKPAPGDPFVATRFRVHRASCPDLGWGSPSPVRSLEDEFRQGKSPCRTCRPLFRP